MTVPHYFWVPAAIAVVYLSGLATIAVVRPSVFTASTFRPRPIPLSRAPAKVEIVVKQDAPAPALIPASAPAPAREETVVPPAPAKKVVRRKAKPKTATSKLRKDWVRQ